MGFVQNEQDEKREGAYLKYEGENILQIQSNLYKVVSHYLKAKNKFVACSLGMDCFFCNNGTQINLEFNYFVDLNGKKGVMNIKPSVFYAINAIEKASKKTKREMSWLVLKTGEGLSTEYTVSKDENLETPPTEEELEKNNAELEKLMKIKETQLLNDYKALSGESLDASDFEA